MGDFLTLMIIIKHITVNMNIELELRSNVRSAKILEQFIYCRSLYLFPCTNAQIFQYLHQLKLLVDN